MKLPPFQALLEEHRTDVYRFLVATAGPAEADDAFQETWIAALRAYPGLRRADNLRAWLFTLMHNLFVDSVRRAGRCAFIDQSNCDTHQGTQPRDRFAMTLACQARDVVGLGSAPSIQ